MADEWRVPVGKEQTRAVLEPADSSAGSLIVLAHGAGGHRDDRGMLALAEEFRRCGMDVVRFNFLYREEGAARPDRMPLLEETFAAVAHRARGERRPARLILGGRSMGGRTASMLAAKGFDCDGLLLLAYPLHPAGQPDKRRDAHLANIRTPTLCFNGTRDSLCDRPLMEQVLGRLDARWWRMHWLEGADHSFHVLKRSGRTDADVVKEIGQATTQWLGSALLG